MRRLTILPLLAPLAIPATAVAQANPVSDAARMMAKDNAKNLLAAAEEMPADKYGFRPTKAQMSFGELIAHIARDNHTTCSTIAGVNPGPRSKLTAAVGKEKLVAALKASLTACSTALDGLKDAALGDSVTWYGGSTTRAMAVIGLQVDWADHYSQQAMYLRLNGILPPTARKGGM